ncbi:MAG: AAA family ATPase [Candidatus Helarchaeota archaeon]
MPKRIKDSNFEHFQINKIVVKNFRSFKKIEIPLRNLNILLGQNDSGKSNFIDIFDFLSDFFNNGVNAIDKREGFSTLVFNHEEDLSIVFDIYGIIQDCDFRYFLEIASTRIETYIRVEAFNLKSINENEFHVILNYNRTSDDNYFRSEKNGGQREVKKEIKKDTFRNPILNQYVTQESNPISYIFLENMKKFGKFHFNSKICDKAIKLKPELILNNDGLNLPNVIQILKNEHIEEYDEFLNTFISLYPQYREIIPKITEDNRIYFKLLDNNFIKHDMWTLSRGLIKIMCILILLYSPKKYRYLAIEEPENHIHPKLLNDLFQYLELISDEIQLFITSHSPYFINRAKFNEIELIHIKKENGISKCVVITKDKIQPQLLRELGLGELYFSGHLTDDLYSYE